MIIIVMGVTGAGKTTVGTLLADQLHWKFADADSFHSPANIEKMRQGIALDDADRAPWLAAMHDAMERWTKDGQSAVLACSALKSIYRQTLQAGVDVKFVYLKGSYEDIFQRLIFRHGHFATEKILSSQFADLEEPTHAIAVNICQTPEEMAAEIRSRLNLG